MEPITPAQKAVLENRILFIVFKTPPPQYYIDWWNKIIFPNHDKARDAIAIMSKEDAMTLIDRLFKFDYEGVIEFWNESIFV